MQKFKTQVNYFWEKSKHMERKKREKITVLIVETAFGGAWPMHFAQTKRKLERYLKEHYYGTPFSILLV